MARSNKPRLRIVVSLLTVSAALWFSPLRTAHAELVVTAPNTPRVKALDDWYAQHIPACFRAQGRLTVRQLTERQMSDYLQNANGGKDDGDDNNHSSGDDNDDIDGIFENDPARITLKLPDEGDPDMLTFAHEYGHYVWFDIFQDSDRDAYTTLYKRQRASHHLVTHYASTNAEEGFAEAFSFYVTEPAVLQRRDSQSYQFFSKWVNDTAPVNTHDHSDQ